MSHLEIYNEMVYDLLDDTLPKISIAEDPKTKEFYLRNITVKPVRDLDDSFSTIMHGESNRMVAAT